MYICPNCNFSTENEMNFCPQCGGAMPKIEPAPVVNEPAPAVNETVTPTPPVYTVCPPPAQKPNLAKKIVGMSLSIFGFFFAILGAIFSLAFVALPAADFIMSIYMSIFSLPTSIIGFIFSKSARNQGDTSAFSSVGKSLGLAGIIIMCVALTVSFLVFVSAL